MTLRQCFSRVRKFPPPIAVLYSLLTKSLDLKLQIHIIGITSNSNKRRVTGADKTIRAWFDIRDRQIPIQLASYDLALIWQK